MSDSTTRGTSSGLPQPPPPRTTATGARTRAVSTRLSLEQGGTANGDSTERSPATAGLLRFSPRSQAGTTGLSPFNRARLNRTRFFDCKSIATTDSSSSSSSFLGAAATTTPRNNTTFSPFGGGGGGPQQQQQQPKGTETQTTSNHNADLPNNVKDGLNLDELRALATRALLETGPQQKEAVFYASLLYAKEPASSQAALLLARAYYTSGQYSSCLKLLQESNIITASSDGNNNKNDHDLDWMEGVLLACQSLAACSEWAAMVEICEDACRLSASDAASGAFLPHFNNAMTRAGLSRPLEDEDDFGWETLQEAITAAMMSSSSSSSSSPYDEHAPVHPLARLCVWRGRAYYETGHSSRAAVFWKRALQMDVRAVDAFNSLLEHALVTNLQAYELLQPLDFSKRPWLQALYLARIELCTSSPMITEGSCENDRNAVNNSMDGPLLHDTSFSSHATAAANNKAASFAFRAADLDASSISILSPGGGSATFGSSAKMTPAHNMSRGGAAAAAHMAIRGQPPPFQPQVTVQAKVDQAFEQLSSVYKLQDSPQVLAMAAKRAYRRYQWQDVIKFCRQLEHVDPSLSTGGAGYTYVATLLLLGHKRTLFQLAHSWVEGSSDHVQAGAGGMGNSSSAQAWFAVGAYYSACGRHHVAQRHYCRATRLQPNCAEAWIAFGCSFAACDESDQALASFRAAQRLSPGEHAALLYMGMEYNRTNHLILAHNFLTAALTNSGGSLTACNPPTGDPLCWHELGVLQAHKQNVQEACDCFVKVLQILAATTEANLTVLVEACMDPYWEATIFNLGYTLRKLRRYEEAKTCYARCIALAPQKCSAYSAFAFCCQLQSLLLPQQQSELACQAVEYYHLALSCKPDDAFATEMLGRALGSHMRASSGSAAAAASSMMMFAPTNMRRGVTAVADTMDQDDSMNSLGRHSSGFLFPASGEARDTLSSGMDQFSDM